MTIDVVCKDVHGNSTSRSYVIKGDGTPPEYACYEQGSAMIVNEIASPNSVTDLSIGGVDVKLKKELYTTESMCF